jgi:hypothetical protein
VNKEYKEAFAEVYAIFAIMPQDILDKIPSGFKDMVENQRDKEYIVEIKEPIEDFDFKKETIAIIGLIYRDFLCSPEEREILKKQDLEEIRKFQSQLESNIFKSDKVKKPIEQNTSQTTNLTVIENKKWYKKLLDLVKRIFKI